MLYKGRELDPVAVWGEWVDMPSGLGDPLPTFLPKLKCPNPNHDTSKRHFQINTRRPYVHCFAHCGISGSYEHALCMLLGIYAERGVTEEDVELAKTDRKLNEHGPVVLARARVAASHKEARKYLLKHTRVSLGKPATAYAGLGTRKTVTRDSEIVKDEKALDGGQFQFLPKEARAYLDRRGIEAAARGKWQLGYDEEAERLVIPALDHRGVFQFLIRREITGSSSLKYLYTDGAIKTSLLFGACYMDRERVRSEGIVLVEGSLDVIRMHQIGQRTTLGILGTGISKKQVRLLDKFGPKRIYLFFDKDGAGVTNIQSARERITKTPLFVVRYPKHRSDPAEMTREEVERAMSRAISVSEFFRKARIASPTKKGTYA
jgi:5S rRNA maturation endonuclease (ribonuclease M5)